MKVLDSDPLSLIGPNVFSSVYSSILSWQTPLGSYCLSVLNTLTYTFRVESSVCDFWQVWHFSSKGIETLCILHLPPQGDFDFLSFSFSFQILRCIFIKLMLAVEINKLNVFDRTLSCFFKLRLNPAFFPLVCSTMQAVQSLKFSAFSGV